MNKHGQTLILFVILIPIILLLLGLVVDTGVMISKKAHIKEVTKSVLKDHYLDSDEVIIKLLEKNGIDSKNLKLVRNNEKIVLETEETVDSIFGTIIGLKEYHIRLTIKGNVSGEKLVFE